ncbi:MAG: NAD-dependent dehydratase, partial [Chloroflexota bacterium]
IELAITNPPEPGEYRVFNQITEWYSVGELAERVQRIAAEMGLTVTINHMENPRVELEEHYYNVRHTKLLDLGLEPHILDDDVIERLIRVALENRDRIVTSQILPTVSWREAKNDVSASQPELA